MSEVIWMRVGDSDSYRSFDSIQEAAEDLGESRIGYVERIVMSSGYGVSAPGYEGWNFISLYWGTDKSADMERELTDEEIAEINLSLQAMRG
jgi:hypothetical protein